MMGRALWFVAGAGAGLYASLRVRRLAYRLTPGGITDQVAVLGMGLRALSDEVRAGMAEREAQIVDQLALPAPAERAQVAEPDTPAAALSAPRLVHSR